VIRACWEFFSERVELERWLPAAAGAIPVDVGVEPQPDGPPTAAAGS